MKTRPAAVANMFYPGDPEVLQGNIQSFLSAIDETENTPKAIITPHAGYIYSGPIAANAFAQLKQASDTIKKVILIGPCHRVPLKGLAVPSDDFFETPLGQIPLDREAINEILKLPQVREYDLGHIHEHSLEVQLPFLQEVLKEFSIVPIVVGAAKTQDVSQVLRTIWGGDETLIVISSDLSHYYDYETAKLLDAQTCTAIERFDHRSINHENACGRVPIKGLLTEADRRNMKVKTLDIRNSGDTAGNKDKVVGYGAWIFEEN